MGREPDHALSADLGQPSEPRRNRDRAWRLLRRAPRGANGIAQCRAHLRADDERCRDAAPRRGPRSPRRAPGRARLLRHAGRGADGQRADHDHAVSRAADPFLGQSLCGLGAEDHHRRLRRPARDGSDSPAHHGALRRHAAGRRAPPGDALLPRPGAVDRAQQRARHPRHRQRQQARAQRKYGARNIGAPHARGPHRLCPGRRHRIRPRAHRLDRRRSRTGTRRAFRQRQSGRVRLRRSPPRTRRAHDPRSALCRRRRGTGAARDRGARGPPRHRAPHRDQASAPFRRRRSTARDGDAARTRVPVQQGRSPHRLSRAHREPRGMGRDETQVPQPVGLEHRRLARGRDDGGRALVRGQPAARTRPANMDAAVAVRLGRCRRELGRARRAGAPGRGGTARLSDRTGTAISRAESPATGLALLLASPEMLRR